MRTRLLLIDAGPAGAEPVDPDPNELAILPADALLGTAVWSPDGHRVALLASAASAPGAKNLLGLGALDLSKPQDSPFHYLADVAHDTNTRVSSPVAPVAWEPCPEQGDCPPGEHLIYAAAVPGTQAAGGGGPLGLLGFARAPSTTPGGLFVVTPSQPGLTAGDAPRLGRATGIFAPAWRSPGSGTDGAPLLGLARLTGGKLGLRAIDPVSGRTQDLGVELSPDVAPGATVVAARWDVAHARALVLARPSDHLALTGTEAVDAWLLDFSPTPNGRS